jgi:hypothetical protein
MTAATKSPVQQREVRKGVKTKLFGVILIILGILDTMLAWRGGFVVNGFYIFLLASGVFLYALGAIRDRD